MENFRRLSVDQAGLLKMDKRKPTDVGFLYGMMAFIAVFLGFFIFCYVNGGPISDLFKNSGEVSTWDSRTRRQAYDDSNYWRRTQNIQISQDDLDQILNDQGSRRYTRDDYYFNVIPPFTGIDQFAAPITVLSLLSIGLGVGVFLLLRYATAFFVWFVLITFVLSLYIAAIFLSSKIDDDNRHFIAPAAVCGITALILTFVIIACRNLVRLVIQILKEAGKAITAMPRILIQPVLTAALIYLLFVGFVIAILKILTAGRSSIVYFTVCYNVVVAIWVYEFIYGCQDMIVAGTISKWFFTRDKRYLGSPIMESVSNLFKYHLGSVAFGALVITIVKIIRAIVEGLRRRTRINLVSCCCQHLENFFKYLTRNVYIAIAMHGCGVIDAGRLVIHLITSNICHAVAVTKFGRFTLCVSRLLVVVLTIFAGVVVLININDSEVHFWALMIPALVGSIFISCLIQVYEIAMDTVFLCFCEDMEENDGLVKPYYMSRDLMKFMDHSKKMYLVVSVAPVGAEQQQAISKIEDV